MSYNKNKDYYDFASFDKELITETLSGIDEKKRFRPENNKEEIQKVIEVDIEEDIINNITIDTSEKGEEFMSLDDKERRKEVNSNFGNINKQIYEHFEIAANYPSMLNTEDAYEKMKELSEKTYMYTYTTSPYEINNLKSKDNITDDEGRVIGTQYVMENGDVINQYTVNGKKGFDSIQLNKEYTNQNLMLILRKHANLNLEKKVTGYRLTLANGTVVKQEFSQNIKRIQDIQSGEIWKVENIRNYTGQGGYQVEIDTELIQSAKLEIEYTIRIKNISHIAVTNFEIIDYLPNNLSFEEDTKLLTEDATNKDFGWRYKAENITTKLSDMNENIIKKDNLTSNEERYIKVVLSKILAPTNNDSHFKNYTEIYSYSNADGRMMGKTISGAYDQNDNIIIGKDYNEKDEFVIKKAEGFNVSQVKRYINKIIRIVPNNLIEDLVQEAENYIYINQPFIERTDSAESLAITVTPPTGIDGYRVKGYIILVIKLISISLLIFLGIKISKKQERR